VSPRNTQLAPKRRATPVASIAGGIDGGKDGDPLVTTLIQKPLLRFHLHFPPALVVSAERRAQ
jgi:hypothetical protein